MSYFQYKEFDQKGLPGSGEKYMSQIFINRLNDLREKFGKPIIITSGYRSPEYNNKVSSTGFTGPHTTGLAVDISVMGQDAYDLVAIAFNMGVFTGIGINQKGIGRFIHLDMILDVNRPRIWSY